MRPRVTKRERKLHLSYELPTRIHAANIYPIPAPNGSTVLLYGHDQGLKILWRGGRRRRRHADVDPIDHAAQDEYEAEEEEVDTDCAYPNIIEELDIGIGSSVPHLAIPNFQTTSLLPAVLRRTAVVAIASTDGAVRLLQLPLAPPTEEQKQDVLDEIVRSQVEIASGGRVTTSLAIKFLPIENQPPAATRNYDENITGHLLVAEISRSLKIWTTPTTEDSIQNGEAGLLRKSSLQTSLARLAFHPSSRSAQLLLADHSGAVRIYDPYAVSIPARRPTSSDSVAPVHTAEPGRWVATFHTTYHATTDEDTAPAFSRREKVIDAKWVLSGRGILVLLEDGQWGLWEINSANKADKPIEKFSIHGFLGSSNTSEPVEAAKSRKVSSRLAPMTPNTRKSKAEELFKGASKALGAANVGGISVSIMSTRAGNSDESVVMWYNADVYSITSMHSFWQRSTSSTGSFGSLYSPGLAHITDIDVINEQIGSVSQLPPRLAPSTTGQMNMQRDLLVAAEHRVIMLQSLRAPNVSRNLFQLAERPASRGDVQMTDVGDSALDQINAVLDNMGNSAPISKSVGFAH